MLGACLMDQGCVFNLWVSEMTSESAENQIASKELPKTTLWNSQKKVATLHQPRDPEPEILARYEQMEGPYNIDFKGLKEYMTNKTERLSRESVQ